MKNILLSVWFFAFILLPSVSFSGSYSVESILEKVEQKKIPDYCAYMGALYYKRTPEGRKLHAAYGNDWIHMHHYCWALVDSQRGRVGEALGNLKYVLQRVNQPRLRAMALEFKANMLIVNDRSAEAVPVYQELIQVKPDAEAGYIGLANIFLQSGDKKTAREIAKQGLTYLPDSEKLKALLR